MSVYFCRATSFVPVTRDCRIESRHSERNPVRSASCKFSRVLRSWNNVGSILRLDHVIILSKRQPRRMRKKYAYVQIYSAASERA